jgi:hypothetical protein
MADILIDRKVIRFTSCCDDDVYLEYLYDEVTNPNYGTLVVPATAPLFPGFTNTCYRVSVYDSVNWIGLTSAPSLAYFTIVSFDPEAKCIDYPECPDCQPKCYTLYNCDGVSFNSTNPALEPYVNGYVVLSANEEQSTWYVIENTLYCNSPVNDFAVDDTFPTPCPCKCYDVTGIFKQLTYIDCDGVLHNVIGQTLGFCSQIYPIVNGVGNNYLVTDNGLCIDGLCPAECYELINCDTSEVIYSTLQSLSQYVGTNTVVQIEGYDGCWSVAESEEICDCTVNVIVVREYESCGDCLPIIAYKLTSCENANDIKYTYQDLAIYVGQYVKVEDCGCFFVELIDFQPPSETTVVILTSFMSCTECLTQYYILRDCNDILDPIYTGTDLSTYLASNLVVNIKGCEGCWGIREIEVPINPVPVTVSNTYEGCRDCQPVLPCICNRMTNYYTADREYQYLDCNDNIVNLKLAAGQTSGKICLKAWITDYPDTDNLEVFGECSLTDTNDLYVCPIETPKRKIKPGYSVPTCDTDRWEKITCRASEILYKEVMRLRYGLTNCCPEDDEKWLIKKELIDLAALVDPDYVCKPVQTCCNNTPSCGCGCNTALKTCNSQ